MQLDQTTLIRLLHKSYYSCSVPGQTPYTCEVRRLIQLSSTSFCLQQLQRPSGWPAVNNALRASNAGIHMSRIKVMIKDLKAPFFTVTVDPDELKKC